MTQQEKHRTTLLIGVLLLLLSGVGVVVGEAVAFASALSNGSDRVAETAQLVALMSLLGVVVGLVLTIVGLVQKHRDKKQAQSEVAAANRAGVSLGVDGAIPVNRKGPSAALVLVLSVLLFIFSFILLVVASVFGSNGLGLIGRIMEIASLLGVLASPGLMLYHHLQKRKS